LVRKKNTTKREVFAHEIEGTQKNIRVDAEKNLSSPGGQGKRGALKAKKKGKARESDGKPTSAPWRPTCKKKRNRRRVEGRGQHRKFMPERGAS